MPTSSMSSISMSTVQPQTSSSGISISSSHSSAANHKDFIDNHSIRDTLKYYPEWGRKGYLYVLNDRHNLSENEKLALKEHLFSVYSFICPSDIKFAMKEKAYNINGTCVPLCPVFLKTTKLHILKKINYVDGIDVNEFNNTFEFLDLEE
ncbi:hypothetical protein LCGC14_1087870 [marine sediment metagenome]|uniref:Uncharacterized protein n=1 Tax=marine sediment metagenome TaxID=412755 RepID=A0A0F9QJA9_9ZZZZ